MDCGYAGLEDADDFVDGQLKDAVQYQVLLGIFLLELARFLLMITWCPFVLLNVHLILLLVDVFLAGLLLQHLALISFLSGRHFFLIFVFFRLPENILILLFFLLENLILWFLLLFISFLDLLFGLLPEQVEEIGLLFLLVGFEGDLRYLLELLGGEFFDLLGVL